MESELGLIGNYGMKGSSSRAVNLIHKAIGSISGNDGFAVRTALEHPGPYREVEVSLYLFTSIG